MTLRSSLTKHRKGTRKAAKATKQSSKLADPAVRELTIADRIRSSRDKVNALEAGHQDKMRQYVADQYGWARVLRDDEDEWKIFIDDPEWPDGRVRPKIDNRQDALRHALRFGIGFGSDKKSKQAANSKLHKLLSALQPSFDADVPAADIPALAEQNGGWQNWGDLNRKLKGKENIVLADDEYVFRSSDTPGEEGLSTCQIGVEYGIYLQGMRTGERNFDVIGCWLHEVNPPDSHFDPDYACRPTTSLTNTKPAKKPRLNRPKAKVKGGRRKRPVQRSRS